MPANDARITAIKEKAEERGLHFGRTGQLIKPKTGTGFHISSGIVESQGKGTWTFHGNFTNDDYDTAESLLAVLSPGPVVVVRPSARDERYCFYTCDLYNGCPWQVTDANGARLRGDDCPDPASPGKEWRLCELPKEEK